MSTQSPKSQTAPKKKTTVSSTKPPEEPILTPTKKGIPIGRIILVVESVALVLLVIDIFLQGSFFFHTKGSKLAQATIVKSLPIKLTPTPATPSASPKIVAESTPPAITLPNNLPMVSNVPSGRSVNVPILMYHYISDNPNPKDLARNLLETTPDRFDAQMNYLSTNGFTPISFDTMYAALEGQISLPAKPIVISIDDGYVDAFINAFPILEKYHFHATMFIPTSLMNQGYYLTWDEITQMQKSGLISFEAHSLTHPDLTTLPPDKMKQEIFQSKQVLESHIGVSVNFFAYPYGTSNQLAREYVKEAGFFGAVGTWFGKTEYERNAYDWPRVRIGGPMTVADFAQKVNN